MTDSDPSLELPDAVPAVLAVPRHVRRRRLLRALVSWTSRIILAAFFLAAGILKAVDPIRFAEDIRNYQLLPDPFPALLALVLPWLEIFAALAVLTGRLYRGGLVLLGGMLAVFLAALTSAWIRGLDIRCGCFGDSGGGTSNYPWSLFRNAVLLSLCGVLLWERWRRDRKTP
jgi:uncharacterized membrane protein YphA (DoxX/SURF4 family)